MSVSNAYWLRCGHAKYVYDLQGRCGYIPESFAACPPDWSFG